MIAFENVNKRFGDFAAVRDLTLDVGPSEFMVLIGPSGCGKSTLLRLLTGLESVDSGRILLGGKVINDIAAKDRDLAMVFQNYALYPHMSVFDNMAFGLKLRGLPKGEIDARVREAARTLGLGELLERRPGALSGGQRQRVALGRAIVRRPKAFLMDEPLSNLDYQLRVQTRAELQKLHARLGAAFLYVTHDQSEAMTMGSRIAVLKEGVLQQVDAPQAIYDRPRNAFVAGFIGSPPMNLLRATLVGEPPDLSVPLGAGALRLPSERAGAWARDGAREVVVGLRAEDAAISGSGELEGRVDAVERLGSDTFIYVDVGAHRLVVRVKPSFDAKPGAPARLSVDLAKLHLFDAKTGLALPRA